MRTMQINKSVSNTFQDSERCLRSVYELSATARSREDVFKQELTLFTHVDPLLAKHPIQFDDFIRTTEPRHIRASQEFFRILKEKGHIFTGTYEGWYDVSTETYYKESDLVEGKSPDGNEVRWVQEENYFFRLSAFAQPLLDHIEQNPRFILPESRKNEVVAFR